MNDLIPCLVYFFLKQVVSCDDGMDRWGAKRMKKMVASIEGGEQEVKKDGGMDR